MVYSVSQRPLTWPNRSSCGRTADSTWDRSIPERSVSTVTQPSLPEVRPRRLAPGRPGSLPFMPEADDDRTRTRRTRRVFSGYGIASAVLGLVAVVAIVLGTLIWSGHRNATDERDLSDPGDAAAADWTGVLINMNVDNVDASLQKLHDGTVGQLNSDFEAAIKPYREVVRTLQSRTTGQIDSVSVRIGSPRSRRRSRVSARRRRHAAAGAGRAHRHRAGRRDLGQRERPATSRPPCAGTCASESPTSTAS